MAQTEVVTTTGITELGLALACGAGSGIKSIVGLEDVEVCVAAAGSTFGDPADDAVQHDGDGLELVNIATVAGTATGVDFDHEFTASATINVVGVHICNDEDDVCLIECCFAGVIAMENTDTLAIDGSLTLTDA